MKVGIPKEIKNNENRVAITPSGVMELVKNGHQVYVQHTAGVGSGISDKDYEKAGAVILPKIEDVYKEADMIIKVKEPIASEYPLIKKDQLVFTYFHFASCRELTDAMIKQKGVCLAYETVEKADRSLPLLLPMSEVAGRMSTQEGAKFLEKPMGGPWHPAWRRSRSKTRQSPGTWRRHGWNSGCKNGRRTRCRCHDNGHIATPPALPRRRDASQR